MFCRNCGHKQNDNANFCHECGRQLLLSKQEIVKSNTYKLSKWLIPVLVSLFFIGGLIYYFKSDSNINRDDSEKLSQVELVNSTSSTVNSLKPSFSTEEAEKLVRKYFNLLDFKEYKKAFELFSKTLQGQIKYEKWEKGYSNTLSHSINSVDCSDFICEIDLVATENTDKKLQKVLYKFRYSLSYDDNHLKIDKSIFVSQEIKEIVKSYDSSLNNDSKLLESFVKVICTNPTFEEFSQGSGTVINDNIILTNFHVSLGYPEYCFVKRVDERGQITYDSFLVDNSLIENSYNDFWLFHIKSDENNIFDPPQKLSLKPCAKEQIQIGDSVRVYGFPGVGGDNLTITDGLVSGVDSRIDGLYITSAKIDHGNSGGTAINTTQNCFLGVPTLGLHGDLESYGGIIDINKILEIEPNLFLIK